MQLTRLIQSLLVSLVLTCYCSGSFAQPTNVPLPAEPGEEVLFFTDRDMYVTTEEIMFSAFCTGPGEVPGKDWSQVLYVELVRWNGKKIAGTKVLIAEGMAHGTIDVPAEVESGNYYLRAYTKWMRNYSPYNYSYLLLKIVNPNTTATETGPDENAVKGAQPAAVTNDVTDQVFFSGMKDIYGMREPVTIDIDVNSMLAGNNIVLGVVREHSKTHPGASYTFETLAGNDGPAATVQYYPEIRGLSLSGKVVDAVQGQPAVQARVNLSTVAEPLYFSTMETDSAGDFLFTFPDIRGDHEFHIAVEGAESGQLDLLIDNDFCTRPVTLPYQPFFLTGDEKDLVRDLALNAQIRSRFGINSAYSARPAEQAYPFYGAPDRTIYEKEYIELKNMGEFFYELVYEVNVRQTNGKASLYMTGIGTLVSYSPLLLMDNIRIDNIDALLDVSCRRVERIEVVNRGYVIGNRFYGGIISLYSEAHDMAGMKLGEDNNFFVLSLPEEKEMRFPDYSGDTGAANVPDRRNTLAWYPAVKLSADKSSRISFYTPDVPGTYTIYLTGVNEQDGALMYATQEIIVAE
ncbi:MAG: hypothetical protein P1P82_01665 [Bacteroidales bacterium]|nr:hypothetical protein [Bacteroidales bacterium]MDT8430252.1 hypothetical protein [Bacteroidales bacterium]